MSTPAPLTDKTGAPVEVRLTPKGNAFGIYIDGNDGKVGSAYFVDHDGARIFFHTEVGDDYSGRGLAGVLVENALADTRAAGLTVVPVCPYVNSWTKKKEWDGPLRQPTNDDLAFVEEHGDGSDR
ncbi:MAG: GNAT family N-acetyltransferase [Mycobacteriaceae bacterium]